MRDIKTVYQLASEINSQDKALKAYEDLKSLGGLIDWIVLKKQNEVAALGLSVGYKFKGWGCSPCFKQISNAIESGEIILKINQFFNPKTFSEMGLTKFKLTEAAYKRQFQNYLPNGKPFVNADELTDQHIEEILKRKKYEGIFFVKVTNKTSAEKKTENK